VGALRAAIIGVGLCLGMRTAQMLAALDPLGPAQVAVSALAGWLGLLVVLSAAIGRGAGARAAMWLVLAFEIGAVVFTAYAATARIVTRAEGLLIDPIAAVRPLAAPPVDA
jgi:hypothetical protein